MIEAMKQALEALNLARAAHGQMLLSDPPQEAWKAWNVNSVTRIAMDALRQAIEQAEKPFYKVEGPLHVVCQCDKCKAQPQREWVGLTEDEIIQQVGDSQTLRDLIRTIDHLLKEKNT